MPNKCNGYIGVNGLLSLGEWRIKGSASYYKTNNYSNYDNGDVYAFTDIDPISSQLSIGQITTSSGLSVNSSLPITGMKLQQSQQMLNPKWSSYAPVIKDRVNSTSAKVTVLDENRVIFSQVFTTGEFEISEFDVASVGSDLKLVIEEDNGTVRHKMIPYFSFLLYLLLNLLPFLSFHPLSSYSSSSLSVCSLSLYSLIFSFLLCFLPRYCSPFFIIRGGKECINYLPSRKLSTLSTPSVPFP